MTEKNLTVFDAIGAVAAGFGKNGWWKCSLCGGFAGFDSDPAASAVTPFCRSGRPEHYDGQGRFIRSPGYTKTHEPLTEEIRKEIGQS